MKKSLIALLAGCLVAFVSTGCKKAASVDTAKLESAFSGAPADIKADLDKAVSALKGNNYKLAISTMDSLIAKSNKMSQAQNDALAEAFVNANVVYTEQGAAASAAEAKAKAGELEAQAKEK